MPHGLWHARLHCPSLSPGNCSNSCPLSCCCYPTISSSVTLLFSCLRSFPASRSFPMSWLFASSSQSIGASGSVLTVPMNTQGWFPLGLNGLISLQSKELSKGFSSTTVWKHQFFSAQPSLQYNSHIHTGLLWLDGFISPLPSNLHPPQHSAGKATISRKCPDTPLICLQSFLFHLN